MAIINLNAPPTSRTFTNPANSPAGTPDDFVFNLGSLTGLSGTYVLDLGRVANESDNLVFQIRDLLNESTGSWTRPIVWPEFVLTSRPDSSGFGNFKLVIPNRQVVGTTPPTDIVFEIKNFQFGTDAGRDSMRIELFTGTREFGELTLNNKLLTRSGAIFQEDAWTIKPAFIQEEVKENEDLFLGVVVLTDASSAASATSGSLSAFSMDVQELVNSKAALFTSPGSPLKGLEIELEISQIAGQFNQTVFLPKTVKANGTTVGDVDWDVLVDPSRTPALALAVEGYGLRNWSDAVVYSRMGVGADGQATFIAPSGGGLTATIGTFSQFGQNFNLRVSRDGGSVIDHFSGFEGLELTAGADTVRIGYEPVSSGASTPIGWFALNPLGGNDTIELRLSGSGFPIGHLHLDYEDWHGLARRGIDANFTGSDRSRDSATLPSQGLLDAPIVNGRRTATATIFDPYNGIDSYRFESDTVAVNRDSAVSLGLDGTNFRDAFRLSADGLGVIDSFRIEASGGIDVVTVTAVDQAPLPIALRQVGSLQNQTLTGLSTIASSGSLTGGRFTSSSPAVPIYEVAFRNSSSGSATQLYADLWRLRQVPAASDGGSNGGFERVGSVPLQTTLVTDNVIAFDERPGQFSAFAVAVSNLPAIASGNSLVFSPNAVYNSFSSPPQSLNDGGATTSGGKSINLDGWSFNQVGENSTPIYLTSIERTYEWSSDAYSPKGVSVYNGIVDKRGFGFDWLVENIDLHTVGARNLRLSGESDYVEQTAGSKAIALHFDGLDGGDSFFYRVRNDDSNQVIVFSLGTVVGDHYYFGRDGQRDILDIDLSDADGRYESTQYIYVDSVDRIDQVRLLNTDEFRVIGKSLGSGSYVTGDDVQLFVYDQMNTLDTSDDREVARIQISSQTRNRSWNSGNESAPALTDLQLSNYIGGSRSAFGSFSAVKTSSGNDEALVLENSIPDGGPLLFGAGDDYVIAAQGDTDIALGAGNDFISVRNHGQNLFVSGGAGSDAIGLSGRVLTSNGRLVATDWEIGSIAVATAQEILRAKHPLSFTSATDIFEWDNGQLDRVLVATNRYDGTTIYFQAEELSFSSGAREQVGAFLPHIQETYNFRLDTPNATDPRRVTLAQNVFGRRGTEDTLTMEVNSVDEALKHVGTWLDATTLSISGTTGILGNSHTLQIKAETASTKWFSTGRNFLSAQFNLVDIENIRLVDSSGADVTIRVVGSNGFNSLEEAMTRANRGDVIFMAEFTETLGSNNAVTAVNASKSVTVDAGLRVVFEGDVNRIAANKLAANEAFTVGLNDALKTGSVDATSKDLFRKHGSTRLLEVLGSDSVNINGSNGNDFIIGNKGRNVIEGRGGNDLLFGGFGADILMGQSGNDILVAGSSARINGISNTPDEGRLTLTADRGFRMTTFAGRQVADAVSVGDHSFVTGDKVVYGFSGGTAASTATGSVGPGGQVLSAGVPLTAASALFVIVDATNPGYIRLASSQANAMAGSSLFITDVGTATTQYIVTDLGTSATNLAGSDYAVGGTGDDIMVATGVTGSLTAAAVRDTITLAGGSGDDRFDLFASLGQINIIGGSGVDTFRATAGFSEVVNPMGGNARVFDFSAVQDEIRGDVNLGDLALRNTAGGTFTLAGELERDGLVLNQLVAPPLPLVNGSGEDGNYQEEVSNVKSPVEQVYAFGGVSVNLQDLLNMHNAHAA